MLQFVQTQDSSSGSSKNNQLATLCDRAWVEIHLSAIVRNVRQIRQIAPNADLLAVVKADAYGHGAIAVARAALDAGAAWLGVATLQEGIALRESGIEAPILLLGVTYRAEQVRQLADWCLQPTLSHPQQVAAFEEILQQTGQTLPVHLKIDTGMSRLGVAWEDAADFARQVRVSPYLEIASVYSHLATADDPDRATMKQQQQRYEAAIAACRAAGVVPPRLHLANSAATLADPSCHYDMVRVGLLLYGYYPDPHLRRPDLVFEPAASVRARVTQVKTVPAGTGISYGHSFVTKRATRVAIASIGYADGLPRLLSNRLQAIARGRLLPQIGTITMDQIALDATVMPDLAPGEIVTLLGRDGDCKIDADDWADMLGTISWEILCGFKHRLPRVLVE